MPENPYKNSCDNGIDKIENQSAAVEVPEASDDMQWTGKDTGWMLNLFGTAIGAGVLYLPVSAGGGGIWPLVILAVLAGPMVWLAHRNLVRFCLSATDPNANITVTVREHFGERAGRVLTLAYFLSIYPILLLYGIGITNVVISYLEHQMHSVPPARVWMSLMLVVFLIAIMHVGEKSMLRAVKVTVYPLVAILCGISLYLIPEWNGAVFTQPVSGPDLMLTLFITTPLLVFSFNHSPACSAFAQSYRLKMGEGGNCARKTGQILVRNTLLLLFVILLFVFSSVLSMTPAELAQAKVENIPVLSVLGYRSGNPVFSILAPAIAFLAIASSYFGVYLGTLEGLQGLVTQYWLRHNRSKPLNTALIRRLSVLFVLLTCWGAGWVNWSVIGMVEMLVVPVLATILYIMPVYAMYKVDRLKHFRNKPLDIFTVSVGIVAISGFLVDQMF